MISESNPRSLIFSTRESITMDTGVHNKESTSDTETFNKFLKQILRYDRPLFHSEIKIVSMRGWSPVGKEYLEKVEYSNNMTICFTALQHGA